jgi:hypothetical protein
MGVEVWGLYGGWKETDKIHSKFYIKKSTRGAKIFDKECGQIEIREK